MDSRLRTSSTSRGWIYVVAGAWLWSCGGGPGEKGGAACRAGTAGCACLGSGSDLQCLEEGLACTAARLCARVSCGAPAGAGCACDGARSCEAGLGCEQGTCTACVPGSPGRGCPCTGGQGCGSAGLACIQGVCAQEVGEALPPPREPRCYTPCSQDVVEEGGEVRRCSSEKVLDGCLGGRVCRRGTCMLAGASGRAECTSDAGCPDFQLCLGGECMASCTSGAECPPGLGCVRKACRLRCSTQDASSCTAGHACVSEQGEAGYCLPLVDAPASEPAAAPGTFALSRDRLELSNVQTSGRFAIVNQSPRAHEFVVRRKAEQRPGEAAIPEAQALGWLPVGRAGECTEASVGAPLRVLVEGNGGRVEVEVCEAGRAGVASWSGALEVHSQQLGTRTVVLGYAERPDGQWRGSMVSFAGSFETAGLRAWVEGGRPDGALLAGVANALVQRFGELKYGRLSAAEFLAVLEATRVESWRWPSVRARCPAPQGACYLYDVRDGVVTYTTDQASVPVPAGAVELPFGMNIRQGEAGPGTGCGPVEYTGRIETSQALHYAGNPSVTLTFAGDPARCGWARPSATLVPVTGFEARAYVGGRFIEEAGSAGAGAEACNAAGSTRYSLFEEPWLVPGFLRGLHAVSSPGGTTYTRRTCRDTQVPFKAGSSYAGLNVPLAWANPVPDGLPRVRTLKLVDGVLINQRTLVILYEEVFASLLRPGEDFSTYGYLLLERHPTTLGAEAYEGMSPARDAAEAAAAARPLVAGCSAEVVREATGGGTVTSIGNKDQARIVAEAILAAPVGSAGADALVREGEERVHYVCTYETSRDVYRSYFGSALPVPADPGARDARLHRECPPGATVTFFTRPAAVTYEAVAADGCNATGNCLARLREWLTSSPAQGRAEPLWRCASGAAYCDHDRWDLRSGKEFYREVPRATWIPLSGQIAEAFRYKTRFRNRAGLGVGFTPSVCALDTDALPYCYDPPTIEQAAARIDCALSIYRDYYGELATAYPETARRLRAYLEQSARATREVSAVDGTVTAREGFEYLWAELLILLGDEAYTAAFAARFDLGQGLVGSFAGARFEPNGVTLAGGAAYEMEQLYRAAQYYQLALDRFYRVSSVLAGGAGRPPLVTLGTAATYYPKLVRASAQKAATLAELARRYQNLNRADLARFVLERGYTAAYLESVLFARLMGEALAGALPEERTQLQGLLGESQRRYGGALRDMREVYTALTSEVNYFGFAPDYVPFPALDGAYQNGFQKLKALVEDKLAAAGAAEERALASDKDFQSGSAAFQGELTSIAERYENELGELCGTFRGTDGGMHPAIGETAHLDPAARVLGDPCGLLYTGQIWEARVQVVLAGESLRAVQLRLEHTAEEIGLEEAKVRAQCDAMLGEARFELEAAGARIGLEELVAAARERVREANEQQRLSDLEKQKFAVCTPTVSVSWGATGGGGGVSMNPGACLAAQRQADATRVTSFEVGLLEDQARAQETKLRELQVAAARWRLEHNPGCAVAQAESEAVTRRLALQVAELELEALRVSYEIGLMRSRLTSLEDRAALLLEQKRDAEQTLIALEAARSNPNVRIYKNDAVLAAERTFRAALREAYRLTKVYEYFTSESYGELGDLFQVRMVGYGQPSLRQYVAELYDAYEAFLERHGNPDVRVAVVSLRDDVLGIPRLDAGGRALTQEERAELFRAALTDVRWLDAKGWLRLPFGLRRERVSPVTASHKILKVEAQVHGKSVGDDEGRLYVVQRGTSMVVPLAGEPRFYAFDELMANVNVSFNGQKVHSPASYYENERLRERPLLNTRWDVVVNQRDEVANQDIELGSLTDVRLYFYYTDFTVQP